MKYLIVIDMQNDFIDGSLGTKEATLIVEKVEAKIKNFDGKVLYTRDTHYDDYLTTQEGKNLPVNHCIINTPGWEITSALSVGEDAVIIDKPTFGSAQLGEYLLEQSKVEKIEEIEFVGLCTDICVISNAFIIKAFLPEVLITVDAACCAGVTVQSHKNALEAMKVCQINVVND